MDRIIEKVIFDVPKQPKAARVAAYARVSSEKDAMFHSLSAQISHYSDLIQHHSGWLYCGVYSDDGITGTKINRPGFLKMLEDCRAGKIDLILVKSISRFARNTVTLLETVRELRNLGVDVYFEEQNIHTLGAEGELMLTILASYAQEEALSVSENQKWRVKKNFKEGRPWACTMLGYRNEDGTFVIVPEEAAVVQRIFSMFLDGIGTQLIANTLNSDGIRSRHGKEFHRTAIRTILQNYSYTGNLLLQTTFREDAITKVKKTNTGELPMYHVKGTHEPIISLEDFNRVQVELDRRNELYAPAYQPTEAYPFTSLITCAKCGKHFRRKSRKYGAVWICPTYDRKGKAACPAKQIPDSVLRKLTAGMDMSRITGITADDGNRLIFTFDGGTAEEKTWNDPSRADSWTPEMRKKAAEHAKVRYEQ